MDVAPSCSFMNWMALTPSNSRKKDRSLGLREARKTSAAHGAHTGCLLPCHELFQGRRSKRWTQLGRSICTWPKEHKIPWSLNSNAEIGCAHSEARTFSHIFTELKGSNMQRSWSCAWKGNGRSPKRGILAGERICLPAGSLTCHCSHLEANGQGFSCEKKVQLTLSRLVCGDLFTAGQQ